MSEIVDRPAVELAETGRVGWLSRGRLLVFRAASVVVEATLVGLVGKLVLFGFRSWTVVPDMQSPHVVAFAYAFALVVTNATAAPPRFDQKTRPFAALAAQRSRAVPC